MQKKQMYKKPKYRNKKVTVDGFTFDSKAEARYYQRLKILQKSGKVQYFEMQKRFTLLDKFKHPKTGKTVRAITYTPDFIVNYSDGRTEVVDVKGYEPRDFPLRAKMFMSRYDVPLVLAKHNSKTGRFEHVDF